MQKIKDRVFLVGVFWGKISREHYNESLEELYRLAKTAEVEVVDSFVQSLKKPDTATYIGKGKLQEIKNTAENMKVRTIIFNNNLSPSQSRNISDITGCNVVDRTELILDIFAKHARTRQAKLQVELAQLEYAYTKLKRMWKHLSRIQGGIGFRGPGETQIEVDRRLIRKRTSILKKKLKTIESISITKRKRRKDIISIALVGYTNAGKSTLFNRLTKENRYTANQLFATLDSKTRSLHIDQSEMMMITDTIGFIRQLPHKLVTSFHSTLLEVIEANLLLHVVDVSRTNILELMDSVSSVLEEIGAADKNILVVFNKTDLVGGKHFLFLKKKLMLEYPDSIFISAKNGEGMDKLVEKMSEFVIKKSVVITLEVPVELPNLISFIYDNAEVMEEDFNSEINTRILKIKIARQLLPNIKKQIEDFNLKKELGI
ncbi:MAG: GTPase HflX [Candidatus Cloacimonetes bacterium]|nr:GTPase HflX [Candidatus Cloacimonadota bacterium]